MNAVLQTGLVLLALVAAVSILARRTAIPSPILLLLCGAGIGLIPGVPRIDLNPELALLVFLPPLVFSAAVRTSWPEFYASLRTITMLAVGLVLATTAAVAFVAHASLGLPAPVAFVLGAVVAPPDEVAAIAIFARLGVPRRIELVLAGEGLINDATALTLYRFATAAVAAGAISLSRATLFFTTVVVGETAWGLLVGWIVSHLWSRVHNTSVEITLSLLTPFAAYLLPEQLGGTGVLSATAAGLYLSWRGPTLLSFRSRLRGAVVWDMIVFLLNGLLFLLTGLQVHSILQRAAGTTPWPRLLEYGAVVSGIVIAVRFLWIYPTVYLPRILSRELRKRDPNPAWQHPFLVAWSGMRGGISLAAALAIPLTIGGRQPFPERDLMIFLTLFVIISTLVVQGLSLPTLIRWLDLDDDRQVEHKRNAEQETRARLAIAQAALKRIDQARKRKNVPAEAVESVRRRYRNRIDHLRHHVDGRIEQRHRVFDDSAAELRKAAIAAEREKLLALRSKSKIPDEVLRRIERDLDLEEARWEHKHSRPEQQE